MNAIREPYPGWLDSMNGPMVATSLISLGLVHAVPIRSDGTSDFVPVDMATNGLLSAIWDYVVNRERNEPQMYNYASSDWNPLVLCEYRPVFYRRVEEYPSAKMIWYPFVLFI
ncbi:putative fatty acyl-CoA reductase CG5065 [Ceratina calcarata]|uniref:Fatty acyl-CoA reductase CG5065 n=1 Tax=Ceratina calcarata TaxID=156304 RepID=A0AAJ7RZW5_9HYME|nr:putative fatty acyl-CoA reductase CG5065 [Ceratina calcarata]